MTAQFEKLSNLGLSENFRILRIVIKVNEQVFFVPQYKIGNVWLEFINYDKDSPYLHPKCFDTLSEGIEFLKNPSIYKNDPIYWKEFEVVA